MESRVTHKLFGKSEQEFIYNIAAQFPNETALLCDEVQFSPGITHDLANNFSEEELPSSVLLSQGLLTSLIHVTKENYDRKKYVELNRGFAAAIAFRQLFLGGDDNYKAFVRAQPEPVALTREQFDALHREYSEQLNTEELQAVIIYMAAFNDVGKAEKILAEASALKGERVLDHDEANALIVKHPLKRKQLLSGLDALSDQIKTYIGYAVGLDFNPPCFVQGEYPLYPLIQIAQSLANVPAKYQEKVLEIIKIEVAMDVAGSAGHQAPGGKVYNKFVHPAFELTFKHLNDLTKGKSGSEVYLDYIELNAKKFGLDKITDLNERITLTRIGLMIRATGPSDFDTITGAFTVLKNKHPDIAASLVKEMAVNNLAATTPNSGVTSVWMQYSPDLLRILTKENKSGQSPVEGLVLGLKIYAHALNSAHQHTDNATPCFMAQGRDIIPTVRKAASGDKAAIETLEKAASGAIECIHGEVKFLQLEPKKVESSNTVISASITFGQTTFTKKAETSPKPENPAPGLTKRFG